MNRNLENNPRKTLLVINYAMDSNNGIFSHQIEVVRRLSNSLEKVVVITNSYNINEPLPHNVEVFKVNWVANKNLINVFRYLSALRRAVNNIDNLIIFSHMTEVQSAVISIWTYIKKIPHYLWYAHASKSLPLRICHVFLDSIITSTPGSCPFSDSKVIAIGQGVDETIFGNRKRNHPVTRDSIKAITIGRLDPSKKLETLISLTCDSDFSKNFSKLTIIGKASLGNENYEQSLKNAYKSFVNLGKLEFLGSVTRDRLPEYLDSSDLFIHAFEGSLDKTLVEATMCRVPVITCNLEYQREFGSWSSGLQDTQHSSLISELQHYLSLNPINIIDIVEKRGIRAAQSHSLEHWTNSLVRIICGGEA